MAVKTILRSALGGPTPSPILPSASCAGPGHRPLEPPEHRRRFRFRRRGATSPTSSWNSSGAAELKSYFDEARTFPGRIAAHCRRVAGGAGVRPPAGVVAATSNRPTSCSTPSGGSSSPISASPAWPDASGERTMAGTMVGTPATCRRSRSRGLAVGSRTDLFAVGIILYQCLTGTNPSRPRRLDGAKQIVHDDPAPPSVVNPEIDPGFDAIIARALAKEPADRYASAAGLPPTSRRMLASLPAAGPGAACAGSADPGRRQPTRPGRASASVSEPTFVEPTGASPAVAPPPPAAPVREPISRAGRRSGPAASRRPVSPLAVAPGGGRRQVGVGWRSSWPLRPISPGRARPRPQRRRRPRRPGNPGGAGNNGVSNKAVETARGTTPAAKACRTAARGNGQGATGRRRKTDWQKSFSRKSVSRKGWDRKGGTEKCRPKSVSRKGGGGESWPKKRRSGRVGPPRCRGKSRRSTNLSPNSRGRRKPRRRPPLPVPARSEGRGEGPSAPAPGRKSLLPPWCRAEAPAKPGSRRKIAGSACCDDLLQRFQLGEGLSPDDLMVLQRSVEK